MTNSTDSDRPLQPQDKALLMERIDRAWAELNGAVRGLSEQELTRPGPDGWAMKDHLAHISAWERSALALLRGMPRHEALGVDEATYQSHDVERVNDAIEQRNRGRPLAEVLADFEQTHADVLTALERLTPDDLAKPYEQYLPSEAEAGSSGPQRPVLDWVVGNTYDHYAEHTGWIRAQFGAR
jgi:uncharacterized protein (TIGR03083 family)